MAISENWKKEKKKKKKTLELAFKFQSTPTTMVVFWVWNFAKMKKEDWGYYPTKNILKLKNIYIQKKKKKWGFWIGFTKFRRGARSQNVFITKRFYCCTYYVALGYGLKKEQSSVGQLYEK